MNIQALLQHMQLAPLSSPRTDLAVGCCHWVLPLHEPCAAQSVHEQQDICESRARPRILKLTAASLLCQNMQLFWRQMLQGS